MGAPLVERLHPPGRAELPAPHLGLQWRPVKPGDGARILRMTIADEESALRRTDPEGLIELLVDRSKIGLIDTIVGVDANQKIQAVASVKIPAGENEVARAELFAITSPKWKGRGIGRALLVWQDARARQMLVECYGADTRITASISNVVDESGTDRRRLYTAAGFSRRQTVSLLRHDLKASGLNSETLGLDSGTAAMLNVPKGYQIIPFDNSRVEAVRKLHIEIGEPRPATTFQLSQWCERALRAMEEKWSFMVIGPDDELAGFAVTCRHATTWVATGHPVAAIEIYGVSIEHQRQGLGAALLSTVIAAAATSGAEELTVESDLYKHPTLVDFYEKLGFRATGARLNYTIEV